MIIPEHNTIFIHTPRTGGTSIERMFDYAGGVDTYDETQGMGQDHSTAREVKSIIGPHHWDVAFKFGFVRNPWGKMVSMYLYRLSSPFYRSEAHEYENVYRRENDGQDIDFETWLTDLPWVDKEVRKQGCYNQLEYFCDEGGQIIVDHIARFELFAIEWQYIKKKMNTDKELIHLNKGHKKKYNYRDYYNDQTRALIAERFDRDIKHFGYKF